MKSKFKSGDIVAARDKLFIVKQGLANSIQQKSWSDVKFVYLAYELQDGRTNTDETYVLKENEMRHAILAPKFKEKIKSNNSLLHEAVPWKKDRYLIKVKDSNKIYCVIGVDLPFYLISELIIKGNDIAIAPSHEIKHSQDLEQPSSYEKALLTGEVKPKTMPTIQQELRLMVMNRNFVERLSNNLDEEQREGVSVVQEYEQHSDIKYETRSLHSCEWTTRLKRGEQVYLYHSELEKIGTEDIDYYVAKAKSTKSTFAELIREIEKNKLSKHEIVTARMSPLEKFLIKVTELVDGLLDSIKGIFKQQPKDSETSASAEVLQAVYAYVDGVLPCPTETRDKLAVFVSEYKKINSEGEKNHVINKIGDTIKIVHYELERDKGDMEKVNQIIDNMIEYIRLINESDKSNTNAKLELEYDYMKKLLEDTKNAKRVSQGDTKSFEDILKEDGFEINRD